MNEDEMKEKQSDDMFEENTEQSASAVAEEDTQGREEMLSQMQPENEKGADPLSTKRDEPVEKTGGITVRYRLTAEMANRVLLYSDRIYSLTKRIVYTILLGGLSLFFGITHFMNLATVENRMLLAVILAAAAAILWIMPWNIRKRKVAAVAETPDEFTLTVYNEGLGVGAGENEDFYPYAKGFNAREDEEYFLFDIQGEKLFGLQKDLLDEAQIALISTRLEQKLEKHFTKKG